MGLAVYGEVSHDGMIHGFAAMIGVLDDARVALDGAGSELRAALDP